MFQVDWSGPVEHLMPTALEWAAERASKGAGMWRLACAWHGHWLTRGRLGLGKHAQAFGDLKQALYGTVVRAMTEGTSIDYPQHIKASAARDTTVTSAKL